MVLNSYCLYDVELDKYYFPFPAENDRSAKRICTQFIAKNVGLFSKDNIKLYYCGSFDEEKGIYQAFDMREVSIDG